MSVVSRNRTPEHLRWKTRRQLYAIIEAQKEQLVEFARDAVDRRPARPVGPEHGRLVVIRNLRTGWVVGTGVVVGVRRGPEGQVTGIQLRDQMAMWVIGEGVLGWKYADGDDAA